MCQAVRRRTEQGKRFLDGHTDVAPALWLEQTEQGRGRAGEGGPARIPLPGGAVGGRLEG